MARDGSGGCNVSRVAMVCAGASLLSIAGVVWGQAASDRIDFAAGEREKIASLTNDGVATMVGRAVVHLPRDAMSSEEARALAARLNQSIDALDAFTRSPRAWQRNPAHIDYYFHPSRFVSYAKPVSAQVFVALPRLQRGGAPLLHETAHVLLSPSAEFIAAHGGRFDLENDERAWLIEGIATYVGMSVSKAAHIPEGDPMDIGSIDQFDARCATALATPLAAEVLPFIGTAGGPEALGSVERRPVVGPVFYGCSASFNKYLAERVGLDALIDLMIAEDSQAQIEKVAGKSVEALRSDWRQHIGAGP